MNARLDDRVAEPDLVVTALLVAAAALYLAFAGWLIAVQVSAGGARHVPTVTIDNQTHLTLQVELVDQHGARLTLGAHPPVTYPNTHADGDAESGAVSDPADARRTGW